MNAFEFGRLLMVKMAAPPSMLSSGPRAPATSPAAGQQNPMAAINAQRVAQIKAEAAKVRAASGVPSIKGTTGTGGKWSGRVMPSGDVQGAQFQPNAPVKGAPTLAPAGGQQPLGSTQAPPMNAAAAARRGALKSPTPAPASANARPTMNQMPTTQTGATAQGQSPQEQYKEWRRTQGPNQPPMPPAGGAQPNVTTTPVDGAAMRRQLQQQSNTATTTSPAPPTDPARDQALSRMRERFTPQRTGIVDDRAPAGGGGGPGEPVQPQNQGQLQAGGHIIRTDNGRLFDTIQKRFIEPPKGAVFGPPGAIHGPALPPRR